MGWFKDHIGQFQGNKTCVIYHGRRKKMVISTLCYTFSLFPCIISIPFLPVFQRGMPCNTWNTFLPSLKLSEPSFFPTPQPSFSVIFLRGRFAHGVNLYINRFHHVLFNPICHIKRNNGGRERSFQDIFDEESKQHDLVLKSTCPSNSIFFEV